MPLDRFKWIAVVESGGTAPGQCGRRRWGGVNLVRARSGAKGDESLAHRAFLVLAAACLLSACGTPPRDVPLAGLDLGEPTVLAELKQGLAPDQRAALIDYAIFHWPGSKSYCGRPAFARQDEPATIGEAIDRTMAFEAALTRKRLVEVQPASPVALRAQQAQQLVDRFEELTLRRSMILAQRGGQVERAGELKAIDRQLETVRRERAKLAEPLA